ncbi:MAG: glycosyltransferase [Devosia nanyangense]|uniref:Glycosyltransferase n=1 Tax=Devosia nanyangense TaxID=1228055 RepID=A0A933L280_9HYPH|nr:glycosyltransferase [Devosia nanyangense]
MFDAREGYRFRFRSVSVTWPRKSADIITPATEQGSQQARGGESADPGGRHVTNSPRDKPPPADLMPAPPIARAGRRAAGMATIPGRVDALQLAVESLAPQVDQLYVYLNGFTEVPAFLRNVPSITTYASAEFGDRGDSGKFFGLRDSAARHFLSVDDDIIYPADYADRLTSRSSFYQAPVGVHGSLLKFPEYSYYDKRGRYLLHFRAGNPFDRRVHLLGTGTLSIDLESTPFNPHLPYPNMADHWVAKYFAERRVPMICLAREEGWLKSIVTQPGTIWDRNRAEQTAQAIIVGNVTRSIVRALPAVAGPFPKILVAIKTFNRQEYLKECLKSLIDTIEPAYDLVVAVADGGSTDGTLDYLDNLVLPFEFHIISGGRAYAPGQFNALIDLSKEIGADFTFVLDDDVVFRKAGWISAYRNAAIESGYHHLCHFNYAHGQDLSARGKGPEPKPSPHSRYRLTAYGTVESAMGALMTLTPAVVAAVGYADETNFFVRGQWHADYSARASRAGFNEYNRFFDISNSSEYIALQNELSVDYVTSLPSQSEDFLRASTPEERERRRRLVRDTARLRIERTGAAFQEGPADRRRITANDVFDSVLVINLDRRPDRMANMRRRLDAIGVKFARVPAVDGESPEMKADYAKLQSNFADTPVGTPSQLDGRTIYTDYRSDDQRRSYIEERYAGPAVRSAGALAYLRTYETILTEALASGAERILVFDDDCVFHRDFLELFDKAYSELPRAWKVFQLGTLQSNWRLTEPYSEHLYRPNGVIVGSHAVGLHREALPTLLRFTEAATLPFDIGPLHYASMEFCDSSFVTIPNLAIQENADTDIGTGVVHADRNVKKAATYRWDLDAYAE